MENKKKNDTATSQGTAAEVGKKQEGFYPEALRQRAPADTLDL